MAKQFTVDGAALIITDSVSGIIELEAPKRDVYFDNRELKNDIIRLYDTNGTSTSGSSLYEVDIAETSYTQESFREFARLNMGFNALTGGSVGTGWAQYGDSQYTVGSPLVISQGTTETIDIDGLGSTVKSQLPNGVSDLYDVATSKIIPIKSGDGYSFSLGFQAASTSNNGDATISVNIGGAFGQIFKRVFRMPRGTGIYHDMYFTTQYYTLGTFLANGGTIEIESGNGTTSIHSITLQIHRTYAAM